MSRPTRRLLACAALAATALAAIGAGPAGATTTEPAAPRSRPPAASDAGTAGVTTPSVQDLTPWVIDDADFAIRVALPPDHPGGTLVTRVFRRLDGYEELDDDLDVDGRWRWATYTTPIDAAEGSVTARVPVGTPGSGPDRLPLEPGVYPVEVAILDPGGRERWHQLTFLQHLTADHEVPVVVVVRLTGTVTWDDTTGPVVDDATVEGVDALTAALSAFPDVPVTLALEPALTDALDRVGDEDPEALASLTAVADRGAVLTAPYVDIDAAAWMGTPVEAMLAELLDVGRARLRAIDGAEPAPWWLIEGSPLSHRLADWLVTHELEGVVATSPPTAGSDPEDGPMRIAATSATAHVAQRVAPAENPVVAANHALAPIVARVAGAADDEAVAPQVLLLDAPDPAEEGRAGGRQTGVPDPALTASLLRALAASPVVDAGVVDDLAVATSSSPEVEPAELTGPALAAGTGGDEIAPPVQDLRALQEVIGSLASATEAGDAAVTSLRTAMLIAASARLDGPGRARVAAAVDRAVAETLRGVELPAGSTVTLTSNDAKLPVTVENRSARQLRLVARARSGDSPMLAEDVTLDLAPGSITDVELPLRFVRSGDYQVLVQLETPDGGIVVAESAIEVRSTSVSGVGILLSVGALAFLGLWWARTLRRKRAGRSSTPPPVTTSDVREHQPVS